MAILLMIFRKMLNNRWLVGSWLLGLLITVALVSSIPTYTAGVLQRLLIKDLEDYQTENSLYPGGLYDAVAFRTEAQEANDQDIKTLQPLESYFQNDVRKYVQLPYLANTTIFNTVAVQFKPQDTKTYDPKETNDLIAHFTSFADLQQHVVLKDGRMPNTQPVNGVYEVLLSESALEKLHIFVNEELVVKPVSGLTDQTVLVKPVGVVKQKDDHDPFWRSPITAYSDSLIMPDELFRNTFVTGKLGWLGNVTFYTAFDYHALKVLDLGRISGVESRLRVFTAQHVPKGGVFDTDFPLMATLSSYLVKQQQLTKMLWSLNVPVFIMLALYIFMVSLLIVEKERTEVAVLRSRGAGRAQILFSYLLEIIMLGIVAIVAGPVLGLLLSRVLGASNGFLEFVDRSALPVQLTSDAYTYGLWSMLACVLMVMIPVFVATRQSIVSHKQQMARSIGSALWHKFFVDILLLLISWYGWTNYQRQHKQLLTTQVDITSGLQLDPLMFFVPALFVLGLGLLCLRVYPWLVRFVYWTGRRLWSPSMYATLIQVGRSSRQYQFLMIFLVMTLAVGIFSASAARTINLNMEDKVRYSGGADITLQIPWDNDAPPPSGAGGAGSGAGAGTGGGSSGDSGDSSGSDNSSSNPDSFGVPNRVQYTEPPFEPLQHLAGVEHAAKVFKKQNVTVTGPSKTSISYTTLMAVNPPDFAQTAWFKSTLLPYHWWNYLNLLSKEPTSALISGSLAKKLHLKVGDYVSVNWQGSDSAQFVIYGIVDYWPSWSPVPAKDDKSGTQPTLIVVNLPYVQNAMGLEPYEVWLKLKPGATTKELYQSLQNEKLIPTAITNTPQEIIKLKKNAFMLGLNGALTLGFLISMSVTLFGFLLYWVLTLSSRRLQYGIFRAMGISLPRLIVMMIWEQLLTSGIACLLGVTVGAVTSRLFVPQFQLFFSAGQQVPPFHVVFNQVDEMRLYVFVGAMLLVGLSILGWLLSRIRIHQAVKLGED